MPSISSQYHSRLPYYQTPRHNVSTPRHNVATPRHNVATPRHNVATPIHRAPAHTRYLARKVVLYELTVVTGVDYAPATTYGRRLDIRGADGQAFVDGAVSSTQNIQMTAVGTSEGKSIIVYALFSIYS